MFTASLYVVLVFFFPFKFLIIFNHAVAKILSPAILLYQAFYLWIGWRNGGSFAHLYETSTALWCIVVNFVPKIFQFASKMGHFGISAILENIALGKINNLEQWNNLKRALDWKGFNGFLSIFQLCFGVPMSVCGCFRGLLSIKMDHVLSKVIAKKLIGCICQVG